MKWCSYINDVHFSCQNNNLFVPSLVDFSFNVNELHKVVNVVRKWFMPSNIPFPSQTIDTAFFSFVFFYSLFILSDIELCSTFEYDLIILLICYSIVLLNVSSRIRNRTFPFHTHHGRRWEKVFVINLKGGGGTCEFRYSMKTVKRRNWIQHSSSGEFNQTQFECNIFFTSGNAMVFIAISLLVNLFIWSIGEIVVSVDTTFLTRE